MGRQPPERRRAVRGTIRRRLLVNAVVDPDEAARHLPTGVRPHVTDRGTVVGCCLLAIEHVRPAGLPGGLGVELRAAAHRISAEWDHGSGTTVGVYVPLRHTDSLPARVLGGRWFPGVHAPASIQITEDDDCLLWTVEPRADAEQYRIRVKVTMTTSEMPDTTDTTDPTEASEPVGATCLAAAVGLSPGRHGALEAARMQPEHRASRPVDVIDLDSQFLAGLTSVRPAPSYLMRDIPVIWTPTDAPRRVVHQVPA